MIYARATVCSRALRNHKRTDCDRGANSGAAGTSAARAGGGGYRWLDRSGGKAFFIEPFTQGTSLGFSERWSSLGKTS